MRSRTGCLTCRQKKLKCDERTPVCRRCIKASRECIPSPGIFFCHQHNASLNGEDSGDADPLKGYYAYRNTFDEDAIWVDIPKHITFVTTTNPYLDTSTLDLDTVLATSTEPLGPSEAGFPSPQRTHSHFCSATSTPSSSGPELSPFTVPCCCTPDLEALLPLTQSPPSSTAGTPISPPASLSNRHICPVTDLTTSAASPPIDRCLDSPFDSAGHMRRSVSTSSLRQSLPRFEVGVSTQDDCEIDFLLRWFSEGPGHWMDLFDLSGYFASYVPVKARENSLLRYAAVACAAKALSCIQARKPAMEGSVMRQAGMEQYPDTPLVDWKHKTAVYYDTAVSLLLHALNVEVDSAPSEPKYKLRRRNGDPTSACDGPGAKQRWISSNASLVSSAEELLAATAILCFYEFLDTSTPEWEKHLSGARSLLVLSQEKAMPLTSSKLASEAWRVTFWNIARQDMLAAFISKTNTRLDTEDLTLWRTAGLMMDEHGCIVSSNAKACSYFERGDATMREGRICNALVWLMAKLVNFVAAGGETLDKAGIAVGGVPQRTLLDQWLRLQKQFQLWHEALPATFRPSARVVLPHTSGQTSSDDSASAFTKILLFLNKPHESTLGRSTAVTRMDYRQSVLTACQGHSRSIVGISLARPDEAVRIHSVQPLFTAGQCLSDDRERQVVLHLLRDVESDIGWATDYRVRQLVGQWQGEG
uniref:Zn(II)2Cys6 transcription factor n=1 Tax=Alternaria alternata TaxID=5599 RepID=A0A3G9HPF0_ALTAL|nr:Zn(II)2Cys6 transcription factor [Alternaria alternata]